MKETSAAAAVGEDADAGAGVVGAMKVRPRQHSRSRRDSRRTMNPTSSGLPRKPSSNWTKPAIWIWVHRPLPSRGLRRRTSCCRLAARLSQSATSGGHAVAAAEDEDVAAEVIASADLPRSVQRTTAQAMSYWQTSCLWKPMSWKEPKSMNRVKAPRLATRRTRRYPPGRKRSAS